MRKILQFLVVVGAVFLAVFLYNYLDAKLNQPLVSDRFAYGNGRIEATEVSISPKISGRVLEIYVKEGEIVAKGQILAKLDTNELDAKLKLAQAQINQAKENKKYAQAILEQKQNELAFAEKNYKRAQELYANKAISLLSYQQEETAYKSAVASLKAASASVAQSSEAIRVAQAQARSIEVNIEDSTLKAPVKGRILYKLAQVGEVVGGGQNLFILLDLLDTSMSIFLSTAQAGKVEYGSEARIVLDAYPHIAIPAKITYISPKAQFTPKQIETQEEREKLMFRVKATIDTELLNEHIEKIKTGLPGMTYIPLENDAVWPQALNKLPSSYSNTTK